MIENKSEATHWEPAEKMAPCRKASSFTKKVDITFQLKIQKVPLGTSL